MDEERMNAFADLPEKHVKRLQEERKLRLERYAAAKDCYPIRKGCKSDYVTCFKCQLLYGQRNFNKHFRKCTGKRAPKNVGYVIGSVTSLSKPWKSSDLLSDSIEEVFFS